MRYKKYSHFNGLEIIKNIPEAYEKYQEICRMLSSITDKEIIDKYREKTPGKSISAVLKQVIEEKMKVLNWENNVAIFDDNEVNGRGTKWKSDYVSAPDFSMTVSFDHASVIPNNLMKMTLASEESHMNKNVQTKFGIIITATENLKINGGFDNVVGEFEKYQIQCRVLQNHLKTPMIIVGLEAPESFRIVHEKIDGRSIGDIELFN